MKSPRCFPGFARCSNRSGSIVGESRALDYRRHPLADADAHRAQRIAPAGPLQLARGGEDQARPRHSERMSEGDRTAVGVDPRIVVLQSQLADARECLRGERLVELDHIHQIESEAGLRQDLLHRGNRAHSHRPRLDAHRGARYDARDRAQLELGHGGVRHDVNGACAVVDARRVTGRDGALPVLAKGRLEPAFRKDGKGSVTAGNSSGINDGACAIYVVSDTAVTELKLSPIARVVTSAAVGVEPRTMGMGPVPAVKKVLAQSGLTLDLMDVIELNEAFAAQALACIRELGLQDDDPRINPNGGAIALGHPLGMSGARLILTAARELERTGRRYALCTMCVGVGQGMATIIERA